MRYSNLFPTRNAAVLLGAALMIAASFLFGRAALNVGKLHGGPDLRLAGSNSGSAARTILRFDDLAQASRIPPQQVYSPGPDPGPPPPFLEMGNPRSGECIVRDVSSTIEAHSYRWTYAEPTLKFFIREYQGQRFAMDFSISDATFKDTGPVTLSYYVNNHFLARLHCAKPGAYHFDRPVPEPWLREANPAIVRAVLDKLWVAQDGTRMAYVLLGAGFRP